MCVPQSARISSRPLNPRDISSITKIFRGASKLPKSFLSGNPGEMPVKCQYKFFTRLKVAVQTFDRNENIHPKQMLALHQET